MLVNDLQGSADFAARGDNLGWNAADFVRARLVSRLVDLPFAADFTP
jgi:hypothetical protein